VVDPPAISDTGPSLAHIRAAAQCIVEPHWQISKWEFLSQEPHLLKVSAVAVDGILGAIQSASGLGWRFVP
jgi:hypothetical protein